MKFHKRSICLWNENAKIFHTRYLLRVGGGATVGGMRTVTIMPKAPRTGYKSMRIYLETHAHASRLSTESGLTMAELADLAFSRLKIKSKARKEKAR